jgi:hypothetical protein
MNKNETVAKVTHLHSDAKSQSSSFRSIRPKVNHLDFRRTVKPWSGMLWWSGGSWSGLFQTHFEAVVWNAVVVWTWVVVWNAVVVWT